MALPRSKYSNPLHTPGKEFTLNGKPYIGWYVKTYQGEFYTGKVLDNSSKQIFPIEIAKPIESIFAEQDTSPDIYSRDKGVWKRYFIQKKANLKIIEVNRERYNSFIKNSQYTTAILDWKIKGPAENQTINGYVYFGAAHLNEINTRATDKIIKGLSSFIKDYSKFVE